MAQSISSTDQLKYVPFSSLVDTTFWHSLSKKKLDELKLDDAPFEGRAFYRNGNIYTVNFDIYNNNDVYVVE